MSYLIYFIQVSLYASIMWGIYHMVWRNRPMHRGARHFLLLSLLLPLVLPFVRLPRTQVPIVDRLQVVLPEFSVTGTAEDLGAGSFNWLNASLYLYLTGAIVLVILYVLAYTRIARRLAIGKKLRVGGYRVVTGTGIGPGTLGQTIFFPEDEVDSFILNHEIGHIAKGHRMDSLFLQIFHVLLWPSPAHWLIGRELKMVHEFEADREAGEADIEVYSGQLLAQAFGIKQAITVGHSFYHHPLKRRIIMLQKKQSSSRSLVVIATIALTGVFVTTALLAQTRKPKIMQENAGARDRAVRVEDRDGNIRNNAPASTQAKEIYKFVEHMPEFKGDLSGWLGSNIRYPDSARARNEQGRSVVQFVVDEDGNAVQPRIVRSSGHALLDEESIRVVKSMPKWNPGTQQGKKVPVYFTLPVSYKLD
jgi:TonB family protein